MTDVIAAPVAPPVDPNAAAKDNAHLVTSGVPLKAAAIPDSQARGDQFGHVPPAKGSTPVGTGTIPAVADTTLTQMPHPATLAGQRPNLEPFGREMNHPGKMPGETFVRDPTVFATDPTPIHLEDDAAPLSKSSVKA